MPLGRQAAALGAAAIGGVQRIKTPERLAVVAASLDQALRHLVGRVPARAVAHGRGRPALRRIATRQGKQGVCLFQLFEDGPGAVVAHELQSAQQRDAFADFFGASHHRTPVAALPQLQAHKRRIQLLFIHNIGSASGGKVTMRRKIRAFAVFNALHEFWH